MWYLQLSVEEPTITWADATFLNSIYPLLALFAAWIQTPDGSNCAFALLCLLALLGMPTKLCLGLTLLMHLTPLFL